VLLAVPRLPPQVSHVVQFDLPADVPAYLHRIGRTARAGTKGLGQFESFTPPVAQRLDASLTDIATANRREQAAQHPTTTYFVSSACVSFVVSRPLAVTNIVLESQRHFAGTLHELAEQGLPDALQLRRNASFKARRLSRS